MRLPHFVRNDILIFVTAFNAYENWGQSPILCHFASCFTYLYVYVIATKVWQLCYCVIASNAWQSH